MSLPTRTIEPVTVFGGYRLMRVHTYRNADGDVDCDYEEIENEPTYPTYDAARAALEANP